MLSFVVTKVTNDFASCIGFYLPVRLGLEIIYPRLSVFSVMAETGLNCAVSVFYRLGMVRLLGMG